MTNAEEIVQLIDELRAPEGASVLILCHNPDFNGQKNEAVVVQSPATDWKEKRFDGDTLVEALQAAAKFTRDRRVHDVFQRVRTQLKECEIFLFESPENRYQPAPPPGMFALRSDRRRRFVRMVDGRIPPPDVVNAMLQRGEYEDVPLAPAS